MPTPKRVREESDGAVLGNSPNSRLSKRQVECRDEERKVVHTSRNRRLISYHDNETSSSSSEADSDCEKTCLSSDLPIGVIRGCASCEGCQKVIARWKPERGCRPTLEDAPVYFPLESEFRDTVNYIASIRAEAEQYGICRIVPPPSWCPPCPLKDVEKRQTAKFCTRVQRLDKLQVREARVRKEKRKKTMKKKRSRKISRDCRASSKRVLVFNERSIEVHDESSEESSDDDGHFGFEPGPIFTLQGFEKYADQFKLEYFGLKEQHEPSSCYTPKDEPSVECIEGEYWRIVEHATEQLEVLYGADIEAEEFGSGFPRNEPGTVPDSYQNSGWNLNNIARLPGSVLGFEEGKISGVLEPWLYVGMCFSSFCWHVEDHHLYSSNFMHFGSAKVWYGVPGYAATKLEEAMKKQLPELFEEQPDLLHNLVTQLSPTVLRAAGVPIYRAVQRPGEFVITFPKAYHAGFNCGFNCAEAVNIAPVDWLPHGQMAVELYKEQRRKTSISHDKLLLAAAKKYLKFLKDFCEVEGNAKVPRSLSQLEVLTKVFKDRVDMERKRRMSVEDFVHVEKMQSDFDAVHERECSLCHYDLHLSAIGCKCQPEIYACLDHVHDLCKCDGIRKYALYRHSLAELDAVVAALEQTLHTKVSNGNIHPEISVLEASEETSEKHLVNNRIVESTDVVCTSSTLSMNQILSGNMKSLQNATTSETEDVKLIVLGDNKDCHDKHSILAIPYRENGVNGGYRPMDLNVPASRTNQYSDSEEYSGGQSTSIDACIQLAVTKDSKAIDLNVLPSEAVPQYGGDEDRADRHSSFNVSDAMDLNVVPFKGVELNASNMSWNNLSMDTQLGCIDGINIHWNVHPMELQSGCVGGRSITTMHPRCMDNGVKLHSNFQMKSTGVLSWLQPLNGNTHSQVGTIGSCVDTHMSTSVPRNILQQCDYLPSQPQSVYAVDLLNVGRLVVGKAWCNKDAIFPAGFQSCVMFPSILDSSVLCLYLSEVLDGGQEGPIFKVSMKASPSEVFMHRNIDTCWQMVQERLNMSIWLHHAHHRVGSRRHFCQPSEINGYKLFGFTTPHIIKAIEALDWQHQCSEYWTGAIKLLGSRIRTGKCSFH